ncbi:2'-5' RNA ligase family protein [Flavisolibacter tropicus]|nr:2'-5' RNA ligase family protein [Flavisolibacter tropicus]
MAIVLPEELNKEVLSYKQYMLDKYNCKVGLKSPAHLTIIPPYWMQREKEQSLLNQLDEICLRVERFPIATKNFSAFKPRTIFIDVDVDEKLKHFKKRVDHFFLDHQDYGAKVDTRPFHPHITIATRDLYKKSFAEAWAYFESKEFATAFTGTGLSTLRHNGRSWDILHLSRFQNAD